MSKDYKEAFEVMNIDREIKKLKIFFMLFY